MRVDSARPQRRERSDLEDRVTTKVIQVSYSSTAAIKVQGLYNSDSVAYKRELQITSWVSKDALRHGVAFAASAVHRRHYTGCVDNEMTSRVLVEAAGNSSTVFKTRNTEGLSCKKFYFACQFLLYHWTYWV